MGECRRYIVGLFIVAVVACGTSHAEITGMTRVATLSQPIFVTHAPHDTSRLFIVQRGGTIRILDLNTGSLLPQPFLSGIGPDTFFEGGLFSMAFHPDYANNGRFFIHGTFDNNNLSFQGASADMSSHVREYTVSAENPNVANTSFTEVLNWVQPNGNHNGGWMGFSPVDGYLYVATGDGGNGNDSGGGHTPGTGNAQDITGNLHGKMLRIDIDGDDFPADAARNYAIPDSNPFVGVTGDDEIWSYGLRNPWRSSFDRATGDLWIGDVGQNAREEISFQPADSAGGENYGWRLREGFIATPTGGVGGASPPGAVDPVYDYTRGSGGFQGNSVTGGYVYRGPDPDLQGLYFFADYGSDNVWHFNPTNPQGSVQRINSQLTSSMGTARDIVSFGEDVDGNLYIVDIGGEVFRIDTDIQLTGDYDGSGVVDAADYEVWRSEFGSNGSFASDGNQDGLVDAADYAVWRDNLGRRLPTIGGGPRGVPEPAGLGLLLSALLGAVAVRRRLVG